MPLYANRTRLQVFLVALLCLVGSGLSSFYLWRDLHDTGQALGSQRLAWLARSQGEMRRRFASTFVWRALDVGDPLYRKDSVRGAGLIEFGSGEQIELSEDSIVVLDDAKNLNLEVMEGAVIIRSSEGDRQISRVAGEQKVQMLDVRLLEPKLRSVFILGDAQFKSPVKFDWKEQNSGGSLTLEVATNKSFRKSSKIPAAAPGAVVELSPAEYYWRLVSESGPASEIRSFRVAELSRPAPVAPLQDQEITRIDPSDPMTFRWAEGIGPKHLRIQAEQNHIEIALDEHFEKIVHRQPVDVSTQSAQIPVPGTGALYWRMVAQQGEQRAASQAKRFFSRLRDKIAMTTYSPKESALWPQAKPLAFRWQSIPEADFYLIKIVEDATQAVAFEQAVSTNFVSWTPTREGKYRWQAVAQRKQRLIGQTDVGKVSVLNTQPIALTSPKPDERIEFWQKPQALEVRWNQDSLQQAGHVYHLEFSRDPRLTKVEAKLETPNTALDVLPSLPGLGLWFARVKLVNAEGDILNASEPLRFYFGPPPVLRAPTSASPAEGSRIRLETTGGAAVLEWEPVENAKAYEVVLREGNNTAVKKIVDKPRLEIDSLKQGRYAWTVRAIDPLDRRGVPLLARTLEVQYGEKLPAPQVIRRKSR